MNAMTTSDRDVAALKRELDHLNRNWEKIVYEARDKARRYRDDPLFSYLVDRGYGTDGYRAFAPFRALDRLLARQINFRENHARYQGLINLEDWMLEHQRILQRDIDARS